MLGQYCVPNNQVTMYPILSWEL